jgi:prophage antirepressor-like protein
MNEIIVKDNIKIENLIYEIRGKQVMLDSDLAKLYGVETKRINEAVKNNIEKFPERYCFQLNDKESNNLRSKISTSKINSHGGRRYNQRVFTEQGVYMLATIIKSRVASEITIAIMDAFVIMKNIINTSLIEQKYINSLVLEHDNEIRLLQESFNKLSTKEKINHIFYNGQIYDAYSLLIDILNKAKKEIIIIDNYAGKELFDITKDIKVNIKIYTKNIDEISKKKYMQEYSNIEIITTDIFHDRFIILDNKELYNLGSSLKDIGKKCTSINRIEDSTILKELISRLTKIE